VAKVAAPRGKCNGAYRTGRYTAKAKAEWREQRALLRELRRLLAMVYLAEPFACLTCYVGYEGMGQAAVGFMLPLWLGGLTKIQKFLLREKAKALGAEGE
jgi:hypothetical protein